MATSAIVDLTAWCGKNITMKWNSTIFHCSMIDAIGYKNKVKDWGLTNVYHAWSKNAYLEDLQID